jgi:hypothetical protein
MKKQTNLMGILSIKAELLAMVPPTIAVVLLFPVSEKV